jgi:hypothetical protein
MAKGVTETFDRIRDLLETAAGVQRPLDTALVRNPLDESNAENVPEEAGPFYGLWPVGERDVPDIITGPIIMRIMTLRLQLQEFCGGGDGVDEEADSARDMLDLWNRCVQVIQDPNNRDYANTGLVYANNFVCGEVVRVGRRTHLTGTFDVRYDTDVDTL